MFEHKGRRYITCKTTSIKEEEFTVSGDGQSITIKPANVLRQRPGAIGQAVWLDVTFGREGMVWQLSDPRC